MNFIDSFLQNKVLVQAKISQVGGHGAEAFDVGVDFDSFVLVSCQPDLDCPYPCHTETKDGLEFKACSENCTVKRYYYKYYVARNTLNIHI